MIDLDRPLAVPQLAHVIVARPAILRHETRPAEQHVSRILNQLLPLNHTLTVRGVRRAADEPFEDRLVGLLHLQHQRIVDSTPDPVRIDTQARVPTEPTPTTLRAVSWYR